MKTLFFCTAIMMGLAAVSAQAETAMGKVVDKQGPVLTVQTQDGQTVSMMTTGNTTYRKHKIAKSDDMKYNRKKGEKYASPLVDEDDWIEVTYTPATNMTTMAEITDVIVYDD